MAMKRADRHLPSPKNIATHQVSVQTDGSPPIERRPPVRQTTGQLQVTNAWRQGAPKKRRHVVAKRNVNLVDKTNCRRSRERFDSDIVIWFVPMLKDGRLTGLFRLSLCQRRTKAGRVLCSLSSSEFVLTHGWYWSTSSRCLGYCAVEISGRDFSRVAARDISAQLYAELTPPDGVERTIAGLDRWPADRHLVTWRFKAKYKSKIADDAMWHPRCVLCSADLSLLWFFNRSTHYKAVFANIRGRRGRCWDGHDSKQFN